MKKISCLIMSLAMMWPVSNFAQQIVMETVWMNGVQNKVANTIPGLDAGWTKPVPGNPGTATASRYGVGKDGKILTTSHKDNAIVAWDGTELTTVANLPDVTTEKWNGTAITTDDAGNIIYNYCFTDIDKSLQYWGVIDNNGNITDVTLSTPVSDLTGHGRLDNISHIVGDVTSQAGGVGFSTTQKSGRVIMFHFKGDGTKVTSLEAKSTPEITNLAALTAKVELHTVTPSPKFFELSDQLAGTMPEGNFYLGIGVNSLNAVDGIPSVLDGAVISFDNGTPETLDGIGDSGYLTPAIISLGGVKYIIRNFTPDNAPSYMTADKNIMAFGLFTLEGECVAQWGESTYTNVWGQICISVEPIDENNANIYLYANNSSADTSSGTVKGCYGAMIKVKRLDYNPGRGTKDDPYIIASTEDFCNGYKKMQPGKITYFKQIADIDMAGITDYVTYCGHSGHYDSYLYYDGGNHVIKNFAPVDRIAGTGDKAYYDTALFGVLSGTVKNLGVIDAQIETNWFEAGILGGFAGVGGAAGVTPSVEIDNVFVTGTVYTGGTNMVAGAMFGTSGLPLNIKNSYVHAEVNGVGYAASFIAKAATPLNIAYSYTSSDIMGAAGNTALVAATDAASPASITLNNVVAFGDKSATNVGTTGAKVYPKGDTAGITEIQSWSAFSDKVLFDSLPALNWQAASAGINDIVSDMNDENAEYYNLQGVKIANPSNGVYIVRKGNKVSKEIIY